MDQRLPKPRLPGLPRLSNEPEADSSEALRSADSRATGPSKVRSGGCRGAACCIEPACYNNRQNIASSRRTISALNCASASLSFRLCTRSTSFNKRSVAGWSSKIKTRRMGAAPSRSRIGGETITETRGRIGLNGSSVASDRRWPALGMFEKSWGVCSSIPAASLRRPSSERSQSVVCRSLALTPVFPESGTGHFREMRDFARGSASAGKGGCPTA